MRRPFFSPLSRRRFAIFRSHRRGWVSLWIFCGLFFFSLFAEFIANDRPLIAKYDGRFFWPVLFDYAETEFGGSFTTEADYTDPWLREQIGNNGWMLFPLIPFSYDTHITSLERPAPSPPDGRNWLGTDDQARDVVAKLLYGFRISVLFGLSLTALASLIGVCAGLLQGYFGGKIDLIGQRFLEIWSSMPQLYVLIILAGVVTPGFAWLLLIMVLFSWTSLVGVVRAEVLRTRALDYVLAAKSMGASHGRIMFRHVLPNAMVATLSFLPFIAAGGLVALTALDFLGFGLPPGSASLGELLKQGYNNLHAPWLGIAGFVMTGFLLTLMVFIGEAVRDAFDPRHKPF